MRPEAVQVDEYVGHRLAVTTVDEIEQSDSVLVSGLDHVVYLVLDVTQWHGLVAVFLELFLDGAEEVVQIEGVQEALLLDVQYAEDVLESLRFAAILQSENKVKIGLVVHFTAVRDALLEDAVEKDVGESTAAVSSELLFAQHAIVVFVQGQILTIHPQSRLGAEPVGLQVLLAQLLVSQLNELVEEPAGEYFRDLHFTSSKRVKEEEELAHGRANVERVERAFENFKLWQSGNELEDVIFQVRFFEVA